MVVAEVVGAVGKELPAQPRWIHAGPGTAEGGQPMVVDDAAKQADQVGKNREPVLGCIGQCECPSMNIGYLGNPA